MRHAKYLILVLFQAVAVQGVAAQDSIVDAPGLREYVLRVLASNAGLRAHQARLGAATSRIGPAGAFPDPTVSLGMVSVPAPSFDFAAEGMTQIAFGVAQTFPYPGKRSAATSVARADSALALRRVEDQGADLASRAAKAYYELSFARTSVELWKARAELAEQAVAVTDARYRSGGVPQTDALRARLARARLQEQLPGLEAAVTGAEEMVNALLGANGSPVEAPLLLDEGGSPTLSLGDAELLPFGDAAEQVLESPSLRVASASVDRAARRARVVEISGRPDFMISFQTGVRFGGRQPFITVRVGIPLPLWSGRKQTPEAEAARFDVSAAEKEYEDLVARFTGTVRARLAALNALRRRTDLTATQIIPLARAASVSALQRYRVGEVELTSVLETQDELFRAQIDLARLVSQYGAGRTELAALTGEEWYR
ncbi:MAG: TolC family protein [Gemmatimonadetes bacterium]|nr:TolC family protein [Gemmatimonadota bacterium]